MFEKKMSIFKIISKILKKSKIISLEKILKDISNYAM